MSLEDDANRKIEKKKRCAEKKYKEKGTEIQNKMETMNSNKLCSLIASLIFCNNGYSPTRQQLGYKFL